MNKELELGKLPPQSIDIEKAVLGALLLEREAIRATDDIITPDTFYLDSHKIIYQSILDLYENNEPVDLLTIAQYLRKIGKLENVGGAFYLTEITNNVNSAANTERHARILQEKYLSRKCIEVGSDIIKNAYDDTKDVFETLDKAEKDLFETSSQTITKNFSALRNVTGKAIKELENKQKNPDQIGILTGFDRLDRMTGGFQKQNLIIIAARPAMGKTAFVLSLARNTAITYKNPVGVFSLEMSEIELTNRILSSECEIDSQKIKTGIISSYEWDKIKSKKEILDNAPIYIDDTAALTLREFRSKARRLVQKHGVKILIVDYLQLMTGKGHNRENEISNLSRGLKMVAKELDVPVIALSQLSRSVESRGGEKRPQLSDLRDSGAIEQDADTVMFLYRPEYYGISESLDENNNPIPTEGLCEIMLEKQRNGGLGRIPLLFIGKFTKFCNFEERNNQFENSGYSRVPNGFDDEAPF